MYFSPPVAFLLISSNSSSSSASPSVLHLLLISFSHSLASFHLLKLHSTLFYFFLISILLYSCSRNLPSYSPLPIPILPLLQSVSATLFSPFLSTYLMSITLYMCARNKDQISPDLYTNSMEFRSQDVTM